MSIKANFDEARQTQLPAVELLLSMGYEYISIDNALKERKGDARNVILRDIAFSKLMEINSYDLNGEVFKFSKSDIDSVIDELESMPFEGLVKTSQNIYQMIMPKTGGKSIEVRKGVSKDFKFFDFENPRNNAFHVTVEYTIQGKQDRRPDLVCFVNGLPFAVLEFKKGSVKADEAINQMIRNQSVDEAPKLFTFAQILIGSNGDDLRYGTTGTPKKFYAVWKEKDDENFDIKVKDLISKKVEIGLYDSILNDLQRGEPRYSQNTDRIITDQDRNIVSILSPERILDLAKNYILYDGGNKIISRYQQFFSIQKMMDRVMEKEVLNSGLEKRRGGIVWHTQGSGKSLTMVMFVKALIEDEHIINPRIIIVTDRRDLDRQIKGTFQSCGLKKEVTQARSGEHLLALIKEKSLDVVTTLVQKFESAARNRDAFEDIDENVFILIDEGHRSHGGMASLEMQRTLPCACEIAFTGTPLMRKERESWRRFGEYIDKYTIDDAVIDGNVLPLIYEPRFVPLTQNKDKVEEEFGLVRERARIKYVNSESQFDSETEAEISKDALISNPQRLGKIVNNVENHYRENFKNTGLKAQLVAPSKFAAVKMQEIFEEHGLINTAVVISDEANTDDKDNYRKQDVHDFLKKIREEKSSIESYEKDVIDSFKDNPDGVEILIVVSKLLTGFDAPRNTVLYLAKSLKDHDLLQAIARVNRLCEGAEKSKTAGFIIDYSENAENLKNAMQLFGNFDENDMKETLIDISKKVYELEQSYADLHDIFRSAHGSGDPEAFMKILGDGEEVRKDFSSKLNNFTKLFSECLSLDNFNENFGKIDLYKSELKKFLELRKISSLRYGTTDSIAEFKYAIQKILDRYVDADEAIILADGVDIRSFTKLKNAIKEIEDAGEKAEIIATQAQKIISEKFKEDPVYYKTLSERIEEIIKALHDGKIQDMAALELAEMYYADVLNKKQDDLPAEILENNGSDIFYRNIKTHVSDLIEDDNEIIGFVLTIFNLIKKEAVVDFEKNYDVQRRIMNVLDDYLYDGAPVEFGINLHDTARKELINMLIELAKNNHEIFS